MRLQLLIFPAAASLLGVAAAAPAQSSPVPSSSAPLQAAGAAVFKQRCAACHATEAGKTSALGPNLAGVADRRAGTADFAYSAALKASEITWTRDALDAYLAAPTKSVPGTRMVVGVADPAQRAAIVDYLFGT